MRAQSSSNPYQSPAATGVTELRFRLPFWRFWLAAVLVAGTINAVTCMLWIADATQWQVWLAITSVQGLFFAAYVGLVDVVRISPHGFACMDIWSRRHFLAWTEIAQVDDVWLLSRHFRIRSPLLRRSLWLPHVIARRSEFRESVQRFAGPECPLRTAVEGLP